MKNIIETLTDAELEQAFNEILEWRKTGILPEGIVRNSYEKHQAEESFPVAIYVIEPMFLFEMAKRFYSAEKN